MPAADTLTLSLRLHDPLEKKNARLSASWVVLQVPRADLDLAPEDFAAKHLVPRVKELEHFAVRLNAKPAPVAAAAPVPAPRAKKKS